MRKRVVITGMGCLTPLGNDVTTTWQNILAGKSGAGPITRYDPSDFKVKIAAEVKDFDPNAQFGLKNTRRMDRFTQYALAAAQEAREDAELQINEDNCDRIGAVIGSGIGGIGTLEDQMIVYRNKGPNRVNPFTVPMMIPDSAGSTIALNMGIRGPNMAIVTACATGTNAIGESMEIIRRGQADVIFAGGSEATVVPIAMAALGVMTALSSRNDDPQHASRPFDLNRDGFVLGEGAGVLILESLEHAQARGADILAELTGYGTTNDAFHISAPALNGIGAAKCMRLAIDDAGLDTYDIDYINTHGTSTALNDKSETAAIKTVFGQQAYQIPASSTKSMTGHLLGATGAVEAIFCVLAIQNDIIPATINYKTPDPECDLDYVPNTPRPAKLNHVMSNSFGFGGHNATIILSQFSEDA
ncbi:MAG: beta-ketoacyl-ACP synthase II [Anaerolineales bacterium]